MHTVIRSAVEFDCCMQVDHSGTDAVIAVLVILPLLVAAAVVPWRCAPSDSCCLLRLVVLTAGRTYHFTGESSGQASSASGYLRASATTKKQIVMRSSMPFAMSLESHLPVATRQLWCCHRHQSHRLPDPEPQLCLWISWRRISQMHLSGTMTHSMPDQQS